MLEDEPRTLAYKNAIEANNAVKDKVVLGKFTSCFIYVYEIIGSRDFARMW